jgi:sn-1 stearoyl-lipid 9-desaturase
MSLLILGERRMTIVSVLFLTGVHIGAVAAFWHFSWLNFWVAVGLYFLTGCIGITLCYHRLLSHRSFKVPKWFERVLATCGVLSMQGSPLEWVGHHRMHHAFSDTPKDPHDSSRGFLYSHLGWMLGTKEEFDSPEQLRKFARDLAKDPYYRFLESRIVQFLLQALLGVALYFIGGIGLVLWGIFLRMVVLYHCTWFVNSATHMWGYRNYTDSGDDSRNTWWVALITFGEGWHNNHHRYQDVVDAGHRWWEFDLTLNVIKTLKFFGLAYDLKRYRKKDLASYIPPLKVETIVNVEGTSF